MTSHLYLDIDGVLNAVGWSGAHTPPWDDLCRPGPALTYSPGLVRGLNQVIANTPELEVFWLTSWEEEAAQFGERLGLAGAAEWRWLPASGAGRGLEWEKYLSIREHVEATRPSRVVWCDDELATEPDVSRWAASVGIHTVSPTWLLTPNQVDSIREYFS